MIAATKNPSLTQYYKDKITQGEPAEALSVFMQEVVRIITGRTLKVIISSNSNIPAPAWTTGEAIYIQQNEAHKISMALQSDNPVHRAHGLMRLKGLVYHEMAHCLWTFRTGDSFWKLASTMTPTSRRAVNILEDQRIESLLVARFPHKRYLNTIVMEHVLSQGDTKSDSMKYAHLLTYGRRYLPVKARRIARDTFMAPDLLPDVEAIIDEYLVSAPLTRAGQAHALQLVREFDDLLKVILQTGTDVGHHEPPPTEGTPGQPGKQTTQKVKDEIEDDDLNDDQADDSDGDGESGEGKADETEQGEAGEEGGVGNDSDDDAEVGPGEGDDADGNNVGDDSGEGEGESSGTGESSATRPADDDESMSGGTSDTDDEDQVSDDEASNAAAKGSGNDLTQAMRDFAKSVNDEVKEWANDADQQQEMERDLVSYRAALHRAGPMPLPMMVPAMMWEEPVPPWASAISARVSQPLKKLVDLFGSKNLRHRNTGNVNPLDYRTRRPGDGFNVFDQFKRSERDVTAFEVVVLVDMSYSTHGSPDDADHLKNMPGYNEDSIITRSAPLETQASRAALAAWAVKCAVDSLPNSVCTVLSFGDGGFTIYNADDKASKQTYRAIRSHGGTAPDEALIRAGAIFNLTDRANKLVIILTDGDWNQSSQGDSIVDYLNTAGVTTALFGFGEGIWDGETSMGIVQAFGNHQCMFSKDLDEVTDLPNVVGQLIRTQLSKRLNKAGK